LGTFSTLKSQRFIVLVHECIKITHRRSYSVEIIAQLTLHSFIAEVLFSNHSFKMLAKYILVSLLAALTIAAPYPVEQTTAVEQVVDSYDSLLIDDQSPKGVR